MASGIECPCTVCRISASGTPVVDGSAAGRFILENATSDQAWLQLRYQLLWKGRLEPLHKSSGSASFVLLKAQAWLEALFILRAASVGMRIDIAVLNSAVTASASGPGLSYWRLKVSIRDDEYGGIVSTVTGRAWQLGISLQDSMQRITLSKDQCDQVCRILLCAGQVFA